MLKRLVHEQEYLAKRQKQELEEADYSLEKEPVGPDVFDAVFTAAVPSDVVERAHSLVKLINKELERIEECRLELDGQPMPIAFSIRKSRLVYYTHAVSMKFFPLDVNITVLGRIKSTPIAVIAGSISDYRGIDGILDTVHGAVLAELRKLTALRDRAKNIHASMEKWFGPIWRTHGKHVLDLTPLSFNASESSRAQTIRRLDIGALTYKSKWGHEDVYYTQLLDQLDVIFQPLLDEYKNNPLETVLQIPQEELDVEIEEILPKSSPSFPFFLSSHDSDDEDEL